MALTQAQRDALKADILAAPDMATYVANGQDNMIRAAYNADASPVVKAWRDSVPKADLFTAMNITKFDALSAGKRDAWRLMMENAPIDMTKGKMRSAITDVWGGADAPTVLTDMLENASRAEVLLSGSTVTESTVSGLKRNWIGDLTDADVAQILRG